jgi:hypothetical protein
MRRYGIGKGPPNGGGEYNVSVGLQKKLGWMINFAGRIL